MIGKPTNGFYGYRSKRIGFPLAFFISTKTMRQFRLRHLIMPICFLLQTSTLPAEECTTCGDCFPRVAVKTNLLHDAVFTPDLGFEISIAKKFSLSAEGVWAWWSKRSANRYWRVAGGWVEMRYWFGNRPRSRALTGHHIGIYGSMHKFDFEFGKDGWQSVGFTYGTGISYGYSFPIHRRLNLDLSARIGYFESPYVKYTPMCGEFYAISRGVRKYFGPTGLEVTLVWFPGVRNRNHPEYM